MVDRTIYRQHHHGEDLVYFNLSINQTDLHVGAEKILKQMAQQSVINSRRQVTEEIKRNREFLTSMVPLTVPTMVPALIRNMYQASLLAGTGPMAAVAGAIAEQTAIDLHQHSQEVIVENGGDLCVIGSKDRIIGIYAGESPLSNRIGVKVNANNRPLGICTSSGTIGHSLSMGKSDAAVIIAPSTALADAVATQLGNKIKCENDIQNALNWAIMVEGVCGALAILNDKIGAVGDIELVKLT